MKDPVEKDHFLYTIFKQESLNQAELDIVFAQFKEVRFVKNEYLVEPEKTRQRTDSSLVA